MINANNFGGLHMKKIFFGSIFVITFFLGCAGSQPTISSATSTTFIDGITLDQAIAEAAIRIEERISSGSKIAPLNFNSPSDRLSSYVLDELTANLVDNGKLVVVNRNEIDLIRSEFDFQYSGEVEDDSMQALGRMLGAQFIISGSFTEMGSFHRIVIRVLNVQNTSVEVQYRSNVIDNAIVTALLTGGRSSITMGISGSTFISEGRRFTVKFLNMTECTWLQDGYSFNGTYKKIDDISYRLEMKGHSGYTDTIFTAKIEGNNLRITGGIVNGELFIKQ
jgi:TolB-like protein